MLIKHTSPWFPEIIGFGILAVILIFEIYLAPSSRAGEQTPTNIKAHLETPAFVKGVYFTSATIASRRTRETALSLLETTELNTVVIDLKDDYGHLAYPATDPELFNYVSQRVVMNKISEIIERLHARSIYVVGRLPVFQDRALVDAKPEFAVKDIDGGLWRDKKGITWLDPFRRGVWEYNVRVARDAYALGFDEIQFDYIRFPSDGDMMRVRYAEADIGKQKRADALVKFFSYLDAELRQKGIPISVDLFGFSYWDRDNELTIGQRIRDAAPFFTALSPMTYPSHYPVGTLGYKNPADHPYEIVAETLKRGKKIMAEFPKVKYSTRPWLQDFDIGANYDAKKIQAQMKAVTDNEGAGWLLWNARNVYTVEALAGK